MANRFCSRLREKARDETLEQTTHLKPIFSNHRMKYAAMIPHLDTLIYSRAVPVAAQLRARQLVDRGGEGRRTEEVTCVHYLSRWERARKSGSMGEVVELVGESIFFSGFVGI